MTFSAHPKPNIKKDREKQQDLLLDYFSHKTLVKTSVMLMLDDPQMAAVAADVADLNLEAPTNTLPQSLSQTNRYPYPARH